MSLNICSPLHWVKQSPVVLRGKWKLPTCLHSGSVFPYRLKLTTQLCQTAVPHSAWGRCLSNSISVRSNLSWSILVGLYFFEVRIIIRLRFIVQFEIKHGILRDLFWPQFGPSREFPCCLVSFSVLHTKNVSFLSVWSQP